MRRNRRTVALIGSHMMGVIFARQVVAVTELSEAEVEDLVRLLPPTVDRYRYSPSLAEKMPAAHFLVVPGGYLGDMDALNLEITMAQENLKLAGIDFDVVDSCPDHTCEVCLDRNLSVAA